MPLKRFGKAAGTRTFQSGDLPYMKEVRPRVTGSGTKILGTSMPIRGMEVFYGTGNHDTGNHVECR